MDISKPDKAAVLARLYNRSQARGMGLFSFTLGDMSIETAQELLDTGRGYFDYVQGRVMKVDLSGDELDTRLYNRDRGDGAAERALEGCALRPSSVKLTGND